MFLLGTEQNVEVGMDFNNRDGWHASSGKVDLFLENSNCNLKRVASLQATRQPLCMPQGNALCSVQCT